MNYRAIIIAAVPMLLTFCATSICNINATDPTERGLSCIAVAIVTSAVIRSYFD